VIGPTHNFRLSEIQHLLPKVDDALNSGGGRTHSVGDVLRKVYDGMAQLWYSDTGLLVTEVCDEPKARVLHVWIAAGELEPVLALADRVEEWARDNGCRYMSLSGRTGWLRVLRERGWGSPILHLTKEL
jgi:hypothetical protein